MDSGERIAHSNNCHVWQPSEFGPRLSQRRRLNLGLRALTGCHPSDPRGCWQTVRVGAMPRRLAQCRSDPGGGGVSRRSVPGDNPSCATPVRLRRAKPNDSSASRWDVTHRHPGADRGPAVSTHGACDRRHGRWPRGTDTSPWRPTSTTGPAGSRARSPPSARSGPWTDGPGRHHDPACEVSAAQRPRRGARVARRTG
jgi:hypothetical protein